VRFLLLRTSVTAPTACKLLCCAVQWHAVLNCVALRCTNTVCPFADTLMCLPLCLSQVGGGA
jgi:hypothetical protein